MCARAKYRKRKVKRLRRSKAARHHGVEVPRYQRIEDDIDNQHYQCVQHCEIIVHAANMIDA